LLLVSVAGLIASWTMLRSAVFGKTAARAGLLANALSLADFLRAALTDSKIAVLIVALASVLFLTVWLAAVGRDLLRLGKTRPGGGT
jgi:Na+/proline symporter